MEKILYVPNPILRQKANPLNKITYKDVEISKRMIDIMLKAPGVGLAANQVGILKQISRERHKNIYLISHRDELQGRVNSVLKVTKEGGFTSYAFVDNAQ